MKVLVLGSDGFFGRNVVSVLAPNHEVIRGTRRVVAHESDQYHVDLLEPESIAKALQELRPEAIVNCAGVVENSEKALINPIMTRNLLEQVVSLELKPKRVIISGSAAEYGVVDPNEIPVKETTPLNPTSIYGNSKVEEVATGLKFREERGVPVTIARIFNPIGAGMGPRFLITNILRQIQEIKVGERTTIEVSRLDAVRDCCHILDAANAVKLLIEGDPKEAIYNISSGKGTSNGEIIDLLLKYSDLPERPEVVETSAEPEQPVASQADISRIQNEFGWAPTRTIEVTVKEIVDAGIQQ
jgi:GDP-4-dehydro-6-deoxy-D-mannose reductase